MKIKPHDENHIVDVYAVYWAKKEGINQRFYLIIPYKGYEGFNACSELESDLIDPSLSDFILKKDDYGGDLLIHYAAHKDNLIYDLIDHDPEAMAKFLDLLEKEGKTQHFPPYPASE